MIESNLNQGDIRVITADTPPVGYVFDQWLVEDPPLESEIMIDLLSDSGSVMVISMPARNLTLTASYSLIPALQIGEVYRGGYIAYIYQSGDNGYIEGEQHGIITVPWDQGSNIQWSFHLYDINVSGATNVGLGDGTTNTIAIITAAPTYDSAAKICDELAFSISFGGDTYDDWVMPSIEELHKLYLSRVILGMGNFDYLSSTTDQSVDRYHCLGIYFGGDGSYENILRDDEMYLRAIRYF